LPEGKEQFGLAHPNRIKTTNKNETKTTNKNETKTKTNLPTFYLVLLYRQLPTSPLIN
jgi:hypothetical protein